MYVCVCVWIENRGNLMEEVFLQDKNARVDVRRGNLCVPVAPLDSLLLVTNIEVFISYCVEIH